MITAVISYHIPLSIGLSQFFADKTGFSGVGRAKAGFKDLKSHNSFFSLIKFITTPPFFKKMIYSYFCVPLYLCAMCMLGAQTPQEQSDLLKLY